MGKVLTVKVKEQGHTGQGSLEYKNNVEISDFRKLALFFFDLKNLGANVEKAFREFQRKIEEGSYPW